ncbi:hypothetical protein GCM10027425_22270 [Alteromonas gracilis]
MSAAEIVTAFAVVGVFALAAVLLVAGVAKLMPGATPSGEGLLPEALGRPVLRVLPWVELVLGAGLLVGADLPFRVTAWAALALTLGFAGLVAVALVRGRRPACHCFGATDAEPISSATLVRNLLLVALAAYAVTLAPWAGLPRELIGLGAAGRALALGLLVLGVVLLAGLVHLRRLEQRLAELEQVVVEPLADDVVAPGASTPEEIPDLALLDAADRPVPLRELATDYAQLLVFVSPGCSSCSEVAPLVPAWQRAVDDEIEVRLVCSAPLGEARLAFPGLAEDMLFDLDGSVARSLHVPGTPCAVLLGSNGTIAAGPAPGIEAMSQLLATIVQAVTVNIVTGQAHQNAGHAHHGAPAGPIDRSVNADHLPAPGAQVPNAPVRSEAGESLLHSALPADQVVMAWSTGCGYCRDVLPQVREHSAAGRVTLLVDEDLAAVRAQGIEGQVLQVLSPGGATAMLRVPGTPAAVRVREGVVVGVGGIGGDHVLDLLEEFGTVAGSVE